MTRKRLLIMLVVMAIAVAGASFSASAATYHKLPNYTTGKVMHGPLTVRSAPSTSASKYGEVAKYKLVTLKGYIKSDGRTWYRIYYKDKKGYIAAEYVKKTDSTYYNIYTPRKYGKVTGEPYINVRSGASTSKSAIGTLKYHSKIVLLGYRYDSSGIKWYRVAYEGKKAYVSSQWVKRISYSDYKKKSSSSTSYTKYSTKKYIKVTADPFLYVRTGASDKSDTRGKLNNGAKKIVYGYKRDKDGVKWLRLSYNGKASYICSEWVKAISYAEYSYTQYSSYKYGKITAEPYLYMRSTASTKGSAVGKISYGTKKILLGYRKNSSGEIWYRVKHNGKYGFVYSKYVKKISKSDYYKGSSSPSDDNKEGTSTESTGSEIIDYALKFKGVPYVWAGASSSGFDCSGFVMYVYGHFGVNLPHSSWDIENYGKGVSYSNAKAGDIICYGNHVGLYMGDGKLLHASSSAGCVAIGQATYREIRTIRRISVG